MSKRLNIGVDVDGVLADFTGAARKLLKNLFNGRPADDLVQTGWDFGSLGITFEEERKLWKTIDATPNWWLNLKPLSITDRITSLCEKHRVIFITNRKDGAGWPIEDQTRMWLKRTYGLVNTNIIISDNKGPVALGLKLDYFIDDRPKNVDEVGFNSPKTQPYILDATYNRDYAHPAITRVKSFNEFVCDIQEAA